MNTVLHRVPSLVIRHQLHLSQDNNISMQEDNNIIGKIGGGIGKQWTQCT